MDCNKSIPQKYHHLNLEERIKIEVYKSEGLSITAIANKLNRNKSTVSRELKRNQVTQKDTLLKERHEYFGDTAHILYQNRMKNSGAKIKIRQCSHAIKYIEHKILSEKWSPDTAIGRYKIEHQNKPCMTTKTIYNYIDKGLLNVKSIDLLLKVKLKRKNRRIKKNKKILGDSIEIRPDSINNREEFGHWEIDTVLGSAFKSSVLLTLTERLTRMEIITKLPNKSGISVQKALFKIKQQYDTSFHHLFKSITCDNGSEFCFEDGFKEDIGLDIFYSHPYSAFERGTNENHNGIIRRFIPKGTSIDTVDQDTIERVCNWMNALPRKILNYQTPHEAFKTHMVA